MRFIRFIIVLAILSISLVAFAASGDVQVQQADVNICHFTSSAENPFVMITIPQSALQEHLGHGDKMPRGGSCDFDPPPQGTEEPTEPPPGETEEPPPGETEEPTEDPNIPRPKPKYTPTPLPGPPPPPPPVPQVCVAEGYWNWNNEHPTPNSFFSYDGQFSVWTFPVGDGTPDGQAVAFNEDGTEYIVITYSVGGGNCSVSGPIPVPTDPHWEIQYCVVTGNFTSPDVNLVPIYDEGSNTTSWEFPLNSYPDGGQFVAYSADTAEYLVINFGRAGSKCNASGPFPIVGSAPLASDKPLSPELQFAAAPPIANNHAPLTCPPPLPAIRASDNNDATLHAISINEPCDPVIAWQSVPRCVWDSSTNTGAWGNPASYQSLQNGAGLDDIIPPFWVLHGGEIKYYPGSGVNTVEGLTELDIARLRMGCTNPDAVSLVKDWNGAPWPTGVTVTLDATSTFTAIAGTFPPLANADLVFQIAFGAPTGDGIQCVINSGGSTCTSTAPTWPGQSRSGVLYVHPNLATNPSYNVSETIDPSDFCFLAVSGTGTGFILPGTNPPISGGTPDANGVRQYVHTVVNAACAFITVNKTVVNTVAPYTYGATTANFSPNIPGALNVNNDNPVANPQWGVQYKVPAGNLNLSENSTVPQVLGVDQYSASWSCSTGTSGNGTSHTTNLPADTDATCTVTNTEKESFVTLTKIVNNQGVVLPNEPAPNDFNLMIDSTSVSSGIQQQVSPGSLVASETTIAGWAPGPWTGDCDAMGAVDVPPGETKACSITNTLRLGNVTVEKDWTGPTWPTGMSVTIQVVDANTAQVYGQANITTDNGTVTIQNIPDRSSINITETVNNGPDCQLPTTTTIGPINVVLTQDGQSINVRHNNGNNYVFTNRPCRYNVEVDKTWTKWNRWPTGVSVEFTITSDSKSTTGTVTGFGQTVELLNIPTTESYTITEKVNGLTCSVPVDPASGSFNEGPIDLAPGEHGTTFSHTIDNRPCEGTLTVQKDWTGDEWPAGMTVSITAEDKDDGTIYGSGDITTDLGTLLFTEVPAGRTVVITEEVTGIDCHVPVVKQFEIDINMPVNTDGQSLNDLLNNGLPYRFVNNPCTVDIQIQKNWVGGNWPAGMTVVVAVEDVNTGEVYGTGNITSHAGTTIIQQIPDRTSIKITETIQGGPACKVKVRGEIGPLDVLLETGQDQVLLNDLINGGENYILINRPCEYSVEVNKVWENTDWPADVTVDINLDSTTTDGSGSLAAHDETVLIEGIIDGSSYSITESVNGRECWVDISPAGDALNAGPVVLGPGEDGKVISHTFINRVCFYVVEVSKDWFFGVWPQDQNMNPWEVEVEVENTFNGDLRTDVITGLNQKARLRVQDGAGHIVRERVFGDECFDVISPEEGFVLSDPILLGAGEDGKVIPYVFENKVCTYIVEVVKEWDDGKWPAGSSVTFNIQSRAPLGVNSPTRGGSGVVTDSTQKVSVQIPTGQGYYITEAVNGVGCYEPVSPGSGVIGSGPIYVKKGQNLVIQHTFINHECHFRSNPNQVLPAVGINEDIEDPICPDLMLSTLVTQDGQSYIVTNSDTFYGNGHAVVQRGMNPSLEQNKRMYVAEYEDGSGIYRAVPVPNARRTRLVEDGFNPVIGAKRQVAYHDGQGNLHVFDIGADESTPVQYENGEAVQSTQYDWAFDDRALFFVDSQGLWMVEDGAAPTLLKAGNISEPDAATSMVAYLVNGTDVEVMNFETGEIVFSTVGINGSFTQPALSGDEIWLAFIYDDGERATMLLKDLRISMNGDGMMRVTDVVSNGGATFGNAVAEPAWYCTSENLFFSADYSIDGSAQLGIWSIEPGTALDTVWFDGANVIWRTETEGLFLAQETVGWQPNAVSNVVPVGSRGNEGFAEESLVAISAVIPDYDIDALRTTAAPNPFADASWYFGRADGS